MRDQACPLDFNEAKRINPSTIFRMLAENNANKLALLIFPVEIRRSFHGSRRSRNDSTKSESFETTMYLSLIESSLIVQSVVRFPSGSSRMCELLRLPLPLSERLVAQGVERQGGTSCRHWLGSVYLTKSPRVIERSKNIFLLQIFIVGENLLG